MFDKKMIKPDVFFFFRLIYTDESFSIRPGMWIKVNGVSLIYHVDFKEAYRLDAHVPLEDPVCY